MSKQLTLNLNKKLIIEAVKADTYITGEIDKSADAVKNSALAYNEQAGDDTYHERKLTRTLAGAVGSLEAQFAEFVDTSEPNGISDTLASAGSDGAFTITVIVSDRYNNGLAYPIAQLSQEYVVNKMLYYWWQSIRPALAKDYLAFSAESLTNIRMCLAKTAPIKSDAEYEDVSGEITGSGTAGNVNTVANLTLASGKFTTEFGTLQTPYNSNHNLKVTCSDPNASFDVKVGDAVKFHIPYTPYSITSSDWLALSTTVDIASDTDVLFVPSGTSPAAGAVLIITSKSAS